MILLKDETNVHPAEPVTLTLRKLAQVGPVDEDFPLLCR